MGDRAEVVLELVLGHADTVIGDRQGAGVLIDGETDQEIAVLHADGIIRQGAEIELVDRVGGVRDQLAQENLLMGIDRIDHHIQELFGFGFELLFSHIDTFFFELRSLRGSPEPWQSHKKELCFSPITE